jgi:hypothetical protein
MKGALQPTDLCSFFTSNEMLCKITGSVHDYDCVINDYYIYNLLFLIRTLKLKAHVWLVTKGKALGPHLRGPEVGPGEAADGRSPQSGEVSARVQQESGGPEPGASLAEDPTVNPGQSFSCKFAGERRKWAFFGHRSNFFS